MGFIERWLRKLAELSHKILNGKLFRDDLGSHGTSFSHHRDTESPRK
jgi:hypothetical protein